MFFFQTGDLVYFSLVDRKPVSEYRHAVGWKKLYHDTAGTLLIAVDSKNHGYLYSPVVYFNDSILFPNVDGRIYFHTG